jgi:hypothetical protein
VQLELIEPSVAMNSSRSSRNMNLKTIVKLSLLFSVCFVCVALLLVREHIVGTLSPRGFAAALALLGLASCLVVVFGLFMLGRKRAAQSQEATAVVPLDPATRKQRIFFIRVWKGMIALLVLGLVTGLDRARGFPVWETLVVVAMNLAMTASLIWVVVRLQRSLR